MQARGAKDAPSPRRWSGAACVAALLLATGVGAADQPHEPGLSPAVVRAALLFARSLRPAVAEFYVTYLRFPVSMRDIDNPAPPSSVEPRFSDTGIITLQLSDASGGKRQIYIIPGLQNGHMQWQCVSPDIVTIASMDSECRYSAGFTPPAKPPVGVPVPEIRWPPRGGSNDASINLKMRDGTLHSIDPVRDYHSLPWQASSDLPPLFAQLTDDSRSRLISVALDGNAGKFKEFADLLLLSRWLSTAGPAAVPYLEAHLDDGHADSAGAALVAICRIERDTGTPGAYSACYQQRLGVAYDAVAYLVSAAARSIEDPPPGYWPCDPSLVELLGAMGPGSRRAIPVLLAQMTQPGAPTVYSQRCSRPQVADALLNMVGSKPTRIADQAVLRAAIGTLMEDAVFGRATARNVQPAPSPYPPRTTMLDAVPWSNALQEQLDGIVTRQMRECDGLGWAGDQQIAALGRTGIRVVNQFLDQPNPDQASSCVNQATLSGALAALLKHYPEEAGKQFAGARTPLAHDVYIQSALQALADETTDATAVQSPAVASLQAFLRDTGYVAPVVQGGVPQFPARSGLHWTPLPDDKTEPSGKESKELVATLRRSLQQLAAEHADCVVPLDDASLLRRASVGRTVSIVGCSEEGADSLLVVGSPAGFKAMRFPDRLSYMQQALQDSLIAMGTANRNGAIVLVVQEPCGNHWRDCADNDDAPYEFLEEDGDWFTYLRARH